MNKMEIFHVYMNYHSLKAETEVLKDINFNVKDGEFISIVGPSGCGKSTLLNIASALEKPSAGKVYLFGKEINKVSSKIGYMFQNDNLFEWLNLWDNVTLGLKVQHKLNSENKEKVNKLLVDYKLQEFKDYLPSELSGGMRQRAALIRILALNPDVLFLDEPFSALDYQTRLKVNDEIFEIIKREGRTAIMVTHDIAEAITMSSRVIVLSKRPAIIKKDIKIEFNNEQSTPLKRREDEKFNEYFNIIWKELDLNDEGK